MLVLHTLGSHGPAYSRRYPPQFAVFKPYCEKTSPQECTDEEVSNAYDNTIVYTDYIISQLIERLKSRREDIDSFLLYASDHGESLGENGVYLHGLPRAIAPAAQTDVPVIVWLSQGFRASHDIDARVDAGFHRAHLTHDNIAHSLLGFFDVDADSYRVEDDVFRKLAGSTGVIAR
jgi:lipid A ethanolaminephosphotransferase